MKIDKNKKIGICIIIAAILILAVSIWERNRNEEVPEIRISDLESQVETENAAEEGFSLEEDFSSDDAAQEEDLLPEQSVDDISLTDEEPSEIGFTVTGMTDAAYGILGIDPSDLKREISDWTQYNGYSQAIGAVVQNTLVFDLAENKCTVTLQLAMEEGNNIAEEDIIVSMDYYKDIGLFSFHL